jgi:hypothetical protein
MIFIKSETIDASQKLIDGVGLGGIAIMFFGIFFQRFIRLRDDESGPRYSVLREAVSGRFSLLAGALSSKT